MPLLSEATQLKKFYTDHLVPRLIRIIPQRNQMVKLSEKVLKRQELLEEHYNIPLMHWKEIIAMGSLRNHSEEIEVDTGQLP